MPPLLLMAASGLAREVLAVLRRIGEYQLCGFLDDDRSLLSSTVDGVPVLGPVSDVVHYPHARLLVCAGQGAVRASIVESVLALGVDAGRFATVIDPAATVSPGSSIGAGSILLAGTVLTASVRVKRHVVVMPNSTLTHDDVLEDFATLASGVSLGGGVHVGRAAYLGMNVSVRQHLRIGAGATVGMGAAVVADVPPGQTWVGVPARLAGSLRTGGSLAL